MSTYYLHHYTTKDRAAGIKNTGIIRASPVAGPDASHGAGVYLTSLSPAESQMKIVGNNWGGTPMNQRAILAMGKVDCCYQVCIPKNHPQIRHCSSDPKDIYLFKGDLNLNDFEHTQVDITVANGTKTISANGGTLYYDGVVTFGR